MAGHWLFLSMSVQSMLMNCLLNFKVHLRFVDEPRYRTRDFWTVRCTRMTNREFRHLFRMQRATFNNILEQIIPLFAPEVSNRGRKRFPPDMCFTLFLWRMSRNHTVRKVSFQFGIGEGSVTIITQTVIQAILASPLTKLAQFPTENTSLENISTDFGRKGFSRCDGAVDRSHIPITGPH